MKKVLTILSLVAFLGISTPAIAAPGGHGGHGGPRGGMHGAPPHRGHGGHHIHAGVHHRPHIYPHGGLTIHTGIPRHSYWGYRRGGYWYNPCYDYRLGWYGDVCYPYPIHGTSFSIRF